VLYIWYSVIFISFQKKDRTLLNLYITIHPFTIPATLDFFYQILFYVICDLILCYLSSIIYTLLTDILTVVMTQNFTITNNKPNNCNWPLSDTSSIHFTTVQPFPVSPLSSPSSSLSSSSSSLSSCFTD